MITQGQHEANLLPAVGRGDRTITLTQLIHQEPWHLHPHLPQMGMDLSLNPLSPCEGEGQGERASGRSAETGKNSLALTLSELAGTMPSLSRLGMIGLVWS